MTLVARTITIEFDATDEEASKLFPLLANACDRIPGVYDAVISSIAEKYTVRSTHRLSDQWQVDGPDGPLLNGSVPRVQAEAIAAAMNEVATND